jgi:O-antigen ligase
MPLLLFIAWLTPFDLPVSQLLHWAMFGTVGDLYLLLLPSVVLAACVAHRIFHATAQGLPPALPLWAISGTCTVLGAVLSGKVNPSWSIQDCVLGYYVPAVAVAGIAVHPQRRAIFSALLRGWEAYLLLGTFALGYAIWQSMSIGSGWWDFPPLQKWTMWRYEMSNPGNAYALWFGNANKASNLLILMLLVVPVTLSIDGAPPGRWRMRCLALLSSAHVIAMCSRLGLLLLPVALLAGGYLRPLPMRTLALASAAAVVAAAANHSVSMEILDALFMGSQESGGGGLLSTFASEGGRFEQWLEIWRTWQPDLQEFLLGYGSGYYGIQSFGTADAETHNFFIDRILASGVLGLLAVLMALLVAWIGTKRLHRRSQWLVRLTIASFVLMCVREFAPSYLFRTSLAGVVVAILVSLPTMAAARRIVPREMPR